MPRHWKKERPIQTTTFSYTKSQRKQFQNAHTYDDIGKKKTPKENLEKEKAIIGLFFGDQQGDHLLSMHTGDHGSREHSTHEKRSGAVNEPQQGAIHILHKVLSLLEACFGLISGSSLHIKIQIMGGIITENLRFKSPLRMVNIFCSFLFFLFKFSIRNTYL